jgi:hypothetical protein
MPSDHTIYLVSCVAKKRASPALAKDLYVSEWFLRVRRYVEATGCRWFILSPKYGLVAPDQLLVPYEQDLKTMSVADRRTWARGIQVQMDHQLPNVEHIVVFAGQRYREFLLEYFRDRAATVEVPLEGLRIGEQLNWLGRHVAPESSP